MLDNLSKSYGKSTSYSKAFQGPQAEKEIQLHKPIKEDLAVRNATSRVADTGLDLFQNAGQKLFGAAGSLLKSGLDGKKPDLGDVMKAAKFNPKELSGDLQKLASSLSKNPVDTIQNMMFGLPTEAIDKGLKTVEGGLKTVEGGLRSVEEQNGLRKQWQGSGAKQIGLAGEKNISKDLGALGKLDSNTKGQLGARIEGQGSVNAGLSGVDAQGSMRYTDGARLENRTRLQNAFGSVDADTKASIGNSLEAQGRMHAGIGGIDGQGSMKASMGMSLDNRTKFDTALGSLDTVNKIQLDATANAQGSVKAGASGINAQGSAEARSGVNFEGTGSLKTALANVDYSGRTTAEAYARANGTATLDARGLRAEGHAEAGVAAFTEVKGAFQTAGLNIGGERLDIRGEGRIRQAAEAKIEGHAKVDATINPPRLGAEGSVKGFAGVKAEAEGRIGLGKFITLTGSVEGRAGAGFDAHGKLGYDNGKIRIGGGFGAAVGLGGGFKGGIEIDVKAMLNATIGTGLEMVAKGLQIASDPAKALRPDTLLRDLFKKIEH